MALTEKLAHLREELSRKDTTSLEKLVHVAQRGVVTVGLFPRVRISRRVIVETKMPPKPFRGMRDLIIRRGTEQDVAALSTIDDTPPELVRERLGRGDFVYLADL